MTTIYINFGSGTNTASAPWTDNYFNTGETSLGTLSADLLDDTSSSTGIGLDVTAVFSGRAGSPIHISGAGGWPSQVFDYYWFTNGNSELTLTGLTNGDSYVIEAAGANGTQPTRDVDITIGGTTTQYDNSGTTTPNAPISFSGTVSGTTLTIDADVVSVFAYLNGLKIEITPGLVIDFEPPTVFRGQTPVALGASGGGFGASQGTGDVTYGGEACTIIGWSDTFILFTIPESIALQYDPTGYVFTVTTDGGATADSGSIPFNTASGISYVDVLNPDTSSDTSIYKDYIGPAFVDGDQCEYDSATTPSAIGVSVSPEGYVTLDSVPVVNQTIDFRNIQSDGTLGADDVYVLEVVPADSGLWTSFCWRPLWDG